MIFPAFWVHDLDPVAVRLGGGWAIRYYGLAYAAAFVAMAALLWAAWRRGRSPLTGEQSVTTMTVLVFAVLIGGRLGWVALSGGPELWGRPWLAAATWRGGMSGYGAMAAVAAASWALARSFRVGYWRLADLLCLLAPPACLFIRVANFINGELWGTPSRLPWAVVFPQSAPPGTPIEAIAPRHPSQLYEAALEGLALLAFTQWRFWRTGVLARPGRLTGEFLLLYALARAACELFREPGAAWALGLGPRELGPVVLAVVGAVLLWRRGRGALSR
ncbi:MAG: prolipoprotein diacylglyceryl transferase [Planctomycetes bacterium]|nr:prolipoprotein diacylglyceryl transferase [Planctomycetota bacterium]